MEAGSSDEEWQSVGRMLRDPWYLVSLAVLFAVLAISLGFAGGSSSASTPGPQAVASPATVASVAVPPEAPAAEPTPTLAQVTLDARRAQDLETDGAALDLYRARQGSYPSSEDLFMTFCSLAYDPGCQVTFVTKKISAADGTYPYWYRSDGKTYTLFARVETPLADNHCPSELPPQLASLPVLCASAPGGTR
jgi:hypothetical protein